MEQFIETNGIKLAYLDYAGPGETLLLMHGLTANAHSFDGLIAAGLNDKMRVVAVDLRGRGKSDKPESGYRMADHAADIIGLMDGLKLEKVILAGHSFGGLLTLYMAAHYPERVHKLVVIDAAEIVARPAVVEAIKPSLDRLGQVAPSWEAYITAIKQSPYYADGFWDTHLERYYRADVEVSLDGSVKARATPDAMRQAIEGVLEVDWVDLLGEIKKPVILINGTGAFGPPGTPPLLSEMGAMETVILLTDCRYVPVSGHHITMLVGENAGKVVASIQQFVDGD
jgi:pimeloyl-ACP methyl ester carboxylesterase